MKQVVIVDSEIFQVTSFGNGLSYLVVYKPGSVDFFVHGDSAITFREEWEALENAFPERNIDLIFAELWDRYTVG